MRARSFEPRRRKELAEELLARARVWLADWHPQDDREFATALFNIAARIESEVTQRLDRVPERAFRSFLDWLGVKGLPARAARLPVVFRMTPGSDPITTAPPVQLQVNVGDTPINFETSRPLRIVPGELVTIVAADPKSDAFFLPPASLYRTTEPDGNPTEWRLKEAAAAGATQLQLDPPIGLEQDMVLANDSGQQYHITGANGGIVTIDPTLGTVEPKGGIDVPAATGLPAGARMALVQSFTPYSTTERNQQEHALYIGSGKALNIETKAQIEIDGLPAMPADAQWWFSGKRTANSPDVEWINIKEWSTGGGKVVLRKPKGAIATKDVGGTTNRWVRATRAAGFPDVGTARDIRLSINCDLPLDQRPLVKAIEGVANTTSLVLDSPFYPLGREPRQFDSFYLGSKEAFSKPSASVVVHFSMGEAVTSARAAIGINDHDYRTFGVREDGRLQPIAHGVNANGEPLVVDFLPVTLPKAADSRPIALNALVRPSAAIKPNTSELHVIAVSGSEVWHLNKDPNVPDGNVWTAMGRPGQNPDGTFNDVAATMVAQTSAGSLVVYAVSKGTLYSCDIGSTVWQDVPVPLPAGHAVALVEPVVPATELAGRQREADGFVVVTDKGQLILHDGTWKVIGAADSLDVDFHPLVVLSGGNRLCIARRGGRPVAFDLDGGGPGFTAAADIALVGHALDFMPRDTGIVAVMTAIEGGGDARLAAWDAFNNERRAVFEPLGDPKLTEGPLRVGANPDCFFCSTDEGVAFVMPLGEMQYAEDQTLTDGVVFTDAATDWSGHADFPIRFTASQDVAYVTHVRGSTTTKWIFQLEKPMDPIAGSVAFEMYEALHSDLRSGRKTGARELTLAGLDSEPVQGGLMYLTADDEQYVRAILTVSTTATHVVVTFAEDLPGPLGGTVQYKAVDTPTAFPSAAVLPIVDVRSLAPSISDADLKDPDTRIEFIDPHPNPTTQPVGDVLDGWAVLKAPWTSKPPDGPFDYLANIHLFAKKWYPFEPPRGHNPALSWEYFDGTSWRVIHGLRDYTEGFAKTDNVKFCVPADLQETEVIGRKNHWIRARLVGGDYGQETLSVITSPAPPPPNAPAGSTAQTVTRNPGSINAPYVTDVEVTYQLCCAVIPEAVVTRDNGGLRIQTDVNRTPGAVVEYFVPLAVALRRASGDDASAGDRAFYLGFNTPLTEGPLQILFLANDANHPDAFPLRVDALVRNHFKPIAIDDGTRGLNETGVIEMTLGESPDITELFGRALRWLRIRPSEHLSSPDTWLPDIRGAYLNATFAIAADTQRFEQLGSSDGSPNQRVALTRPPIIDGTLKLRVLERLGDEDIEDLRSKGFDIQPTFPNFPKRQGCWVLWKQVADPADEPAGARVYGLDDATGVITFGDGLRGMIPPIGANVLLAEEYRHGGGEAANRVTAWSQVNLVTALAGVNAVIAPDGAAGGSDAQDPETTVRFAPANLRLRDRALTRADFEVLTLQFSRDVAQARAIATGTGTRLIVAMRGRSAKPSARVLRELRTYLSDRSLPGAASPGVLRITPPEEVAVRITVTLVIDAIENSGEVATTTKDAIAKLLDPAIGGLDGVGWPLGRAPSETDMSAALVRLPHVETVMSILPAAVDGTPIGPLKPWQLIRVIPDGVIVEVKVDVEVSA